MAKDAKKQQTYITVPAEIINSLLVSHPLTHTKSNKKLLNPKLLSSIFTLFLIFALLLMLKLYFNLDPFLPCSHQHLIPPNTHTLNHQLQFMPDLVDNHTHTLNHLHFIPVDLVDNHTHTLDHLHFIPVDLVDNHTHTLNHLHFIPEDLDSSWFWKQPDGFGYSPCLQFSNEYSKATPDIFKDRSKYLMVVVSGGMNQQRNQIVDAVVIARILGAALVVPVLQVNLIWADDSEFSDIFDLGHFKTILADDVRIVSSLPSTHLRTRPVEESQTPLHASPRWIRQHYLGRLRRTGVLLLRGLDSRLSKDLSPDLQKLRCKVAFQALKFAPHIQEIGNKIAERMRNQGPYIALHLRMEKDVWIRTGCSPGLTAEYDEIINNERKQRPKLLTAKSNMTAHERKLAGLCPLTPLEVARLLKALGAPRSARVYWAGGIPFGGKDVLRPLVHEFPYFYNKEDLSLPGELQPFAHRASFMAAIDYIVCEKSDVFMASHGGNMGHAIQGHRAYAGHKKYITPNKRHMLPYFLNSSLPEKEFNKIVKQLHQESLGQPEFRTSKPERDVTKYPVPECMCNGSDWHSSTSRQFY